MRWQTAVSQCILQSSSGGAECWAAGESLWFQTTQQPLSLVLKDEPRVCVHAPCNVAVKETSLNCEARHPLLVDQNTKVFLCAETSTLGQHVKIMREERAHLFSALAAPKPVTCLPAYDLFCLFLQRSRCLQSRQCELQAGWKFKAECDLARLSGCLYMMKTRVSPGIYVKLRYPPLHTHTYTSPLLILSPGQNCTSVFPPKKKFKGELTGLVWKTWRLMWELFKCGRAA